MDSYPPIHLQWVELNEHECNLVFQESQVILFRIRRIATSFGIFKPKTYEYVVASPLTNPGSASRIGGYFKTLEEARANAERLSTVILRGPNSPINAQNDDDAATATDVDKKAATEREIELSWAANPDRSGGQFTQDEINDSGWR